MYANTQGISEPAWAAVGPMDYSNCSIYFSRLPPMKSFCSLIINKPPMVVSNHLHPPLSLCHILNSLLAFLIVQYYLILINHSTSPIIPQMPYLDVETWGQLVGMCQAGLSFRAIAQLNNLPLTTVYKTFQKYQDKGTVTTPKKTGQPMKLNERDWQQLSRIITQCRRLTVAQVASLMTLLVSTQTIKYEIHKLGKHSRISPKKPYL
ncbi:hypothetical protein O181_110787 [Austropuccinia psidii MF-1]|uniref:Uncharacterized protein n=1 Tax=Austropuccinia psidii MF-1 TaxID=1389203 RepID=A0A9Q3PSR4_9BASI|nr:hypothetical protein [Austropuccinia psidii MF-1]